MSIIPTDGEMALEHMRGEYITESLEVKKSIMQKLIGLKYELANRVDYWRDFEGATAESVAGHLADLSVDFKFFCFCYDNLDGEKYMIGDLINMMGLNDPACLAELMPDCLKTAPLLFQVIRFLHKYWGYVIPVWNQPLVVTVKATTALGEPLNQEALAIRTACQLFTDNMMVFISSDEDRLIIHSLYAMMDSLLEVVRIGLRSEPNWSLLWWKQE